MDTITKEQLEKEAQLGGILRGLTALGSIPSGLIKSYLSYAAALGLATGAGAGVTASYIKEKNRKLTSLDRQKKFYDRKIEEMENENWLNDIITIRKKLESTKTPESERKELTKKYLELLNK